MDNSSITKDPGPSPAKVIQGPAEQSWQGILRPPANTPQEALSKNPLKNPVDPQLGK